MRLIDKDALLDKACTAWEADRRVGYLQVVDIRSIIDAPIVEAAEVIRCKDCRWHEQEDPGMVYCPHIVGNWVEDDFFCGSGKRRIKNENHSIQAKT